MLATEVFRSGSDHSARSNLGPMSTHAKMKPSSNTRSLSWSRSKSTSFKSSKKLTGFTFQPPLCREHALYMLAEDKLNKKQSQCEKDNSKYVYSDLPNKFEFCPPSLSSSQLYENQKMKQVQEITPNTTQAVDSPDTPPIGDVVMALSGSPYTKPAGSSSEDTFPLLENNTSGFGRGKNSFDNIVSKTETSNWDVSRRSPNVSFIQRSLTTPASVTPPPTPLANILEIDEDKKRAGKKRKSKLRIDIPKEISTISGIKQLSAAETRKINEAIELANSFTRMSAVDHTCTTPHTPGSSSKESLPSSLESPTSHSWFSFRKRAPREDKKAFHDSLGTVPASFTTPEAQEAYNSLVIKKSVKNRVGLVTSTPVKAMPMSIAPMSANHLLRGKRAYPTRRPRSSLSDSESRPVSIDNLKQRPMRHPESAGAWSTDRSFGTNSSMYGERITHQDTFEFDADRQNNVCYKSNVVDGSISKTSISDDSSGATLSQDCSTIVTVTPADATPDTASPANGSPKIIGSSTTNRESRLNFSGISISMFEVDTKISNESLLDSTVNSVNCAESTDDVRGQQQTTSTLQHSLCPPISLSFNSMNNPSTDSVSATDDSIMAPPPIPPRIPLRKSTVNATPAQRRHPLPSDPVFPSSNKTRASSEMQLQSKKKKVPTATLR